MKQAIIPLIIFISTLQFSKAFTQSADESMIKGILDKQVTAWNAGDVESFMQGYWKDDSLKFIGKSGVTSGWEKTLNNYKKNYPDKAAMGTLAFDLLQVKPLSPGYYFVIGKWHLQRTAGDLGGHFTLLFKKINGVWLIITDHSS